MYRRIWRAQGSPSFVCQSFTALTLDVKSYPLEPTGVIHCTVFSAPSNMQPSKYTKPQDDNFGQLFGHNGANDGKPVSDSDDLANATRSVRTLGSAVVCPDLQSVQVMRKFGNKLVESVADYFEEDLSTVNPAYPVTGTFPSFFSL
jgi:hypothetical protein